MASSHQNSCHVTKKLGIFVFLTSPSPVAPLSFICPSGHQCRPIRSYGSFSYRENVGLDLAKIMYRALIFGLPNPHKAGIQQLACAEIEIAVNARGDRIGNLLTACRNVMQYTVLCSWRVFWGIYKSVLSTTAFRL